MANVIGLSAYHEDNLRKLAAYLLSGELKAKFDMDQFTGHSFDIESEATTCGSVGCAIGHGPDAGIPKATNETWYEYAERVFGVDDDNFLYSWCFDMRWTTLDNTANGAGKRILYMLDKGFPINARDQCSRRAPLCYL